MEFLDEISNSNGSKYEDVAPCSRIQLVYTDISEVLTASTISVISKALPYPTGSHISTQIVISRFTHHFTDEGSKRL
jgi:hypothetical protein